MSQTSLGLTYKLLKIYTAIQRKEDNISIANKASDQENSDDQKSDESKNEKPKNKKREKIKTFARGFASGFG